MASTGGGTTSTIAGGSGNATTQSAGTSQTPNNTTTLSPAEVRFDDNLYNLASSQSNYMYVKY